MTKYYSKSTNGFYASEINASMPSDAIEITEEQWKSLLDGQATGKVVDSDENGNPILKTPDPVELTDEQKAKALAKQSALAKLAALGLTEAEISAILD